VAIYLNSGNRHFGCFESEELTAIKWSRSNDQGIFVRNFRIHGQLEAGSKSLLIAKVGQKTLIFSLSAKSSANYQSATVFWFANS
jgi:hypothetical protein